MSLNTRDTYEKLTIPIRVSTNISYTVVEKEFSRYEDCVEYLNSVYNGHGDVISTFDNYKVSTHSQLHSDFVKTYCSDPALMYDICGLLGDRILLSSDVSQEMDETFKFPVEKQDTLVSLELSLSKLTILLKRVTNNSSDITQHQINVIEGLVKTLSDFISSIRQAEEMKQEESYKDIIALESSLFKLKRVLEGLNPKNSCDNTSRLQVSVLEGLIDSMSELISKMKETDQQVEDEYVNS